MRALHAGIDAGMNFIDTADVYGDGRSERLVARLRRERPGETIRVATKAGRRLPQQTCEGYSRENLVAWIERSLTNLEMDALDLLQLHCPPSQLYRQPEVFGILDDLATAGKLRYYGVSVETVDEALNAMLHPGVQSIQIIFNMFRLKPAETVLAEAAKRQIGILARVPLASGLLTGKLRRTPSSPPTITDRSIERVRRSTGGDAVRRRRSRARRGRAAAAPGAAGRLTDAARPALILMFDGVTARFPAHGRLRRLAKRGSRGAAARCRDDGRREAGLR